MNYKATFIFLLLLILVPAASAFNLTEIHIRINQSGDAVIIANFDESPAEFFGVQSAGIAGSAFLIDPITVGSMRNISILCNDYGVAMFSVEHFAEVKGTQYETPFVNMTSIPFENVMTSVIPISLNPEVTVIFPDGYYVQEKADGAIQPINHTLGPQQENNAPEPSRQCPAKKDLPLSGVLPDKLAPAASVVAGITLTAAGLSAFGSSINLWFGRILAFLENAVGGVFGKKVENEGKGIRTLDYYTERRAFWGFSVREVIVLVFGAFIFGILFFFAARDPVDLALITIYIIMGGIALILHELAHWYMTRRFECYTEVRFWGLGTIIMVITSWLFGNVFAQPTLTLVRHRQPLDKRSTALIMLAGPLLSLLIAFLCLCLVPLGGVFMTAGMIGFMINLLTAVFEFLPISPCDGSDIWSWSGWIWALFFLPLIGIYLVVTL